MSESLALRHCILSVRGRRNIGWCWHRAKCRISRMKLQPSLPYWNCLTLKAVLSPLMPWAPKNHRGSDSAGATDYILCLKANHPTLFQQIDTWFETARAEAPYPYLQNTPRKQGIIAPKSVKCGRSHRPIAPCIRQRNGWDCKQLSSSNVPAICGIKPLTRFSSTLAVFRVPELPLPFVSTGALKIPCTGRSMSPLVKMIAGCALCAPHNLALLRRFAVNT